MGWFSGLRRNHAPLTPEEMLARGRAGPVLSSPLVPASGGFRLVVEDVFFITGRGVVATGRVQGVVHIGSAVSIDRNGLRIGSSEVRAIEMFRATDVRSATTGDNVGLQLAGLTREQVTVGDVLTG